VVDATSPLPEDSHAALLDLILRRKMEGFAVRLAQLEIVSFPEFLAGAAGGEPIEFRRISAAAPTPLAQQFESLAAATREIEGEQVPDDRLAPNVKLAGNELANFSAFFKKEWRDNDWLWGRLDAVPTLVDLLLPPETGEAPTAQSAIGPRAELVRRRQEEIISEHFSIPMHEVGTFIRGYRTGLEKIDERSIPGVGESLDALAATTARVAAAFAPEPVRRYVLWPMTRVVGLVVRRLVRTELQPPVGAAPSSLSLPHRVVRRVRPWAIAFLVTVMAVWLAFGLADSKVTLAGGFVAGILIAPVPVLILWRALRRPVPVPPRPPRPPPSP
ncbi:MAG: DUF3376 domain-containing protein, partial [Actinomycetota bacterium]|nr:DUF3376 domain-containing protein [Actinomycetota bacterium]